MKYIRTFLFFITCCSIFSLRAQIVVKGYVDHVIPDDVDTLGNIKLNVTGGVSPYTYKWMPGNTTSMDRTSATKNLYTLRVKGNNGDSVFYYYNLGYKIKWGNFNGCAQTNDSLYPATTSPPLVGNPTAISRNILRPNVQGWTEFVMMAPMQSCLLGFLDSVSVSTTGDVYDYDYAMHITSGNYLYAWSGGSWIYLTTVNTGDVIKVGRNATQFYISKNNVGVHSVSTSLTSKSLKVKAFMSTSPFLRVGASFADSTTGVPLRVRGIVDHVVPETVDTLGNIYTTISGGSTPYNYKWTPGNVYNRYDKNILKNQYTLRVKSFLGDSVIYKYNLGYKTVWTNLNGMACSNDTLKIATTVPAQVGYPTCVSVNKLAASTQGWTEMVVRPFVSDYLVGFLDSAYASLTGNYTDMDYCFHLTYGNSLYAWASSIGFVYLGVANAGDVITMGRNATNFYILKNNTSVHTMAITTTKALQLKTLITADVLTNIGVSFQTPPLNLSSSINNIHYCILNRKLDGGYYNSITNGNKYFYFKFDEEYYVPASTNLTYKIYDNAGTLITTTPTMVEVIGDNRFALNVNTLTVGAYYKVYVYNKKNEVWQGRLKVN